MGSFLLILCIIKVIREDRLMGQIKSNYVTYIYEHFTVKLTSIYN